MSIRESLSLSYSEVSMVMLTCITDNAKKKNIYIYVICILQQQNKAQGKREGG